MENTPTPPKMGVRARERNALERIAQLEKDLTQVVGSVQQALNQLGGRLGSLGETLDALVELTAGVEQVQSQIESSRALRAQAQADAAKAALEKALADGVLLTAEKISENSILTGSETDKDGNVRPPGYIQLQFGGIKPEFQEKLKGQGVGFVLETEEGGKFTVTGVYEANPNPPKAEEQAAPAPVEAPVAPEQQ